MLKSRKDEMLGRGSVLEVQAPGAGFEPTKAQAVMMRLPKIRMIMIKKRSTRERGGAWGVRGRRGKL